jgi:hypothetical protein
LSNLYHKSGRFEADGTRRASRSWLRISLRTRRRYTSILFIAAEPKEGYDGLHSDPGLLRLSILMSSGTACIELEVLVEGCTIAGAQSSTVLRNARTDESHLDVEIHRLWNYYMGSMMSPTHGDLGGLPRWALAL